LRLIKQPFLNSRTALDVLCKLTQGQGQGYVKGKSVKVRLLDDES
jgi:hypothetical protein